MLDCFRKPGSFYWHALSWRGIFFLAGVGPPTGYFYAFMTASTYIVHAAAV